MLRVNIDGLMVQEVGGHLGMWSGGGMISRVREGSSGFERAVLGLPGQF